MEKEKPVSLFDVVCMNDAQRYLCFDASCHSFWRLHAVAVIGCDYFFDGLRIVLMQSSCLKCDKKADEDGVPV